MVCPHLPPSYVGAHRAAVLGVGPVSFVPLLEVKVENIEKALLQAQKARVKELSRELGARLQAEDGIPGALAFIARLIEANKVL